MGRLFSNLRMTLISDKENKSLTDVFVLVIYENVEFMVHANSDGNLCSRSPKWDSSRGSHPLASIVYVFVFRDFSFPHLGVISVACSRSCSLSAQLVNSKHASV